MMFFKALFYVLVGILSVIVDNIPVMFAVLSMNPDMSHGQWLLVTLTAGVALMGPVRRKCRLFAHLKCSWAIALDYAASIAVHMRLNQAHKKSFRLRVING